MPSDIQFDRGSGGVGYKVSTTFSHLGDLRLIGVPNTKHHWFFIPTNDTRLDPDELLEIAKFLYHLEHREAEAKPQPPKPQPISDEKLDKVFAEVDKVFKDVNKMFASVGELFKEIGKK